eukprot:243138_1
MLSLIFSIQNFPIDFDIHIMGANLCCCDRNELLQKLNPKEDKKQSLLDQKDEYDTDDDADAYGSLQEEENPKTYRQSIEQVFWQFAGSSGNSKKNLNMTVKELKTFLTIIHLNDNKNSNNVMITTDKFLQVIQKSDAAKPLISCNEFCDFFCDVGINPQCEQIKEFTQKQSNWTLLKNASKIFDIVDEDKSGAIEYDEFKTFCEFIEETDPKRVEQLWNTMDQDNSGQIVIHELFAWYQKRLMSEQQNDDK